ncbi:TonB-dependent receptor plug domain-containing protein [Alkalitalea saponilacus]|uniref:TonB-dependent outer membrane receptor, SusC/RagA subfamily, signature region n=1 Tax=Alkalitalea saponilacus TaxID=889453 RepID=A0A1T5EQP0_9BACT|nr:TonB-dependent receptor plug domain-containing protein [Alkalitalea saponilacus]ASB48055.1 TonB-dependent receptor [Alkalitalea saponilacus]SKB86226.1 TonB-dependent outer membrane receptor, SusC/RagA subfamily, signature region [Alkalitalea saponilacus]
MKRFYFIGLLFFLVLGGMHAQRVVQGYVLTLDDFTVSNIEIRAKNSGAAVQSDSAGHFVIVTEERDVLTFSGKVFDRERVRINRRTPDTLEVNIKFKNTPENRQLAVGYGYMNERDITFAASQIDHKREDFCMYSDVFELIKGRFPGVQVLSGGREPEVIIRGMSSVVTSNCALYVVDGVVVNSIGHISPCQISKISVLRDSSASIYGSRGANGVVLIETKRAH